MKYIDLGLPSGTLWANRNVGANKPSDYGDYFNFDDAQKQGTLPARWQMCELVECCKHEVTEQGGVKGVEFTGKNGNSIFMPFAGILYSTDNNPDAVNKCGRWWSSVPYNKYAYSLYLSNDDNVYPSYGAHQTTSFSVRLVKINEK